MKLVFCLLLGAVAALTAHAETTKCPSLCLDQYEPVCGSDGITYSNKCRLSLADCESPDKITQVHEGECSTSLPDNSSGDACSDVCLAIYKPVCGSDGVTYSNGCMLGIAQCQSGGAITQVSDGQCPETKASETGTSGCSEVCIEIFKPVCGTDGVTYPNSCFLGIATCKNPSITQAHEGACTTTEGGYETNNTSNESSHASISSCPNVCLAIYAPVCGSDGVTYSNECTLNVASCEHPELQLTKVSDGVCPPSDCKTAL